LRFYSIWWKIRIKLANHILGASKINSGEEATNVSSGDVEWAIVLACPSLAGAAILRGLAKGTAYVARCVAAGQIKSPVQLPGHNLAE